MYPRIPRDCGTHLTTLDNLLSYFQIVRLLRKTLFDPYQFAEESKLEHILEPSPHVVSQRELTQLRQKIKVVVHH
jgi:SNF-related kinase